MPEYNPQEDKKNTLPSSFTEHLDTLIGEEGIYFEEIRACKIFSLNTKINYLKKAMSEDCYTFLDSLDLIAYPVEKSREGEIINFIKSIKLIHDLYHNNEIHTGNENGFVGEKAINHWFKGSVSFLKKGDPHLTLIFDFVTIQNIIKAYIDARIEELVNQEVDKIEEETRKEFESSFTTGVSDWRFEIKLPPQQIFSLFFSENEYLLLPESIKKVLEILDIDNDGKILLKRIFLLLQYNIIKSALPELSVNNFIFLINNHAWVIQLVVFFHLPLNLILNSKRWMIAFYSWIDKLVEETMTADKNFSSKLTSDFLLSAYSQVYDQYCNAQNDFFIDLKILASIEDDTYIMFRNLIAWSSALSKASGLPLNTFINYKSSYLEEMYNLSLILSTIGIPVTLNNLDVAKFKLILNGKNDDIKVKAMKFLTGIGIPFSNIITLDANLLMKIAANPYKVNELTKMGVGLADIASLNSIEREIVGKQHASFSAGFFNSTNKIKYLEKRTACDPYVPDENNDFKIVKYN